MTSATGYQVRQALDAEEMAAALELRHDVFCLEQGVPPREELDGRDDDGTHLVAVTGNRLLGTCRLLIIGRTAQFSRLAVRTDSRRRGIATALLEAAEGHARALRADRLVLHAQTYAQPLYDRAGYRIRGRVFVEAGIEHVAMEKLLGMGSR